MPHIVLLFLILSREGSRNAESCSPTRVQQWRSGRRRRRRSHGVWNEITIRRIIYLFILIVNESKLLHWSCCRFPLGNSLSDASYGVSQTIPLGDFQHGGDNICEQFLPVFHIPPTQSPQPPPFCSCIGPSISSHSNPYIRDYDNGRVPTARWRHQHYVSATANFTCFGVPLANTSQMDGVVAQVVRDNMRGHW